MGLGKEPTAHCTIWWCPYDKLPVDRTLLTPEEIAAADGMAEAQRARFVARRGYLRRVLAREAGPIVAASAFSHGENGKPRTAPGKDLVEPPVHFNLSDDRTIVVVAVYRDGPVGVDIEWTSAGRSVGPIVERFFAPREREQVAGMEAESLLLAFYRVWVRKEAIIKLHGGDALRDAQATDTTDPGVFVSEVDVHPKHVCAVALKHGARVLVRGPAPL